MTPKMMLNVPVSVSWRSSSQTSTPMNGTEMDIQSKNGLAREVQEDKSLGNWFNKKGFIHKQIEELEKKAEGIIVEIRG